MKRLILSIYFFQVFSDDHAQIELSIAQVADLAPGFVFVPSLAAEEIPCLARAGLTAGKATELTITHSFNVREFAIARVAIGKLVACLRGFSYEQYRVCFVKLVGFALKLKLTAVNKKLLYVVDLLSTCLLLDCCLFFDVSLLECRVESVIVQKQIGKTCLHFLLALAWLSHW